MPKGKYTRKLREVIIPVGPSIAYLPITRSLFALIDSEDAASVGQYNWFAGCSSHFGHYAVRNLPGGGSSYLHRFVMGEGSLTVDHKIPGNTLDCRKSNLRFASQHQQQCNHAIQRNNRSGYKGVSWFARDHNWRSRIQVNGKQKTLGYFETSRAAAVRYNEAALMYFGEYAFLNDV